jgi:ABC-type Fe3+/spermidine/putrescine transport system ATPase subunit
MIFTRPEKIGIGSDPTTGIPGTVLEVKFLGAHYRLLIKTSEMDLIAYVEKAPSIHHQVFIFPKSL